MFKFNIIHAEENWEENAKTQRLIEGTFTQTIPATTVSPRFQNDVIKELYNYDFRLPPVIIEEILSLPEDSLIQDLKKVLDDSVARYEYFLSKQDLPYENTQFLTHAIFFIAEKKRVDLLPSIFNLLTQGHDFTEFYLCEAKTELLWLALYKLAKNDPGPLFDFLKVRNVDTFCKTPVCQALEQLFYHNPELQEAIIDGYKELISYFIEYEEDDELIDTMVIAELACNMRDTAFDRLDYEIKQLYEHGLMDVGYAGTYESLTREKFNELWNHNKIWSLPEMYEHVLTTWSGYNGEYDNERLYSPETHQPYKNTKEKTGRNDPCPCGSGKKYKKCCLDKFETMPGS